MGRSYLSNLRSGTPLEFLVLLFAKYLLLVCRAAAGARRAAIALTDSDIYQPMRGDPPATRNTTPDQIRRRLDTSSALDYAISGEQMGNINDFYSYPSLRLDDYCW